MTDLVTLVGVATAEPRSRTDLIDDLEGATAKPAHTVELGSWLGLLTVDMELSDYGVALRWLAENRDGPPGSTLLSDGMSELLLWLLLRVDTLLLALLQAWLGQPRTGVPRIEDAIGRLLTDSKAAADPDHLVPAMHLSELLHDFESEPGRGERALAARLEILANLGLVHHGSGDTTPSEPDPRLKALGSRLRGVPLTTDEAGGFLDQQYFTGLVTEPLRSSVEAATTDRILLWLVRAYLAIHRPLGFTPGRPISLLACCLAIRAGTAIEVRDVYKCVYEAADSHWSEYLHFSGGSRFDREFLIRIDAVLEGLLESEVDTLPLAP